MLDGAKGSFGMLLEEGSIDPDVITSWMWSSNFPWAAIVESRKEQVRLYRWDAPDRPRTVPLPQNAGELAKFHRELETFSRTSRPDVVKFVINVFRKIRETFRDDSALESVKLLNLLLLAASLTRNKRLDEAAVRSIRNVASLADAVTSVRSLDDQFLPEGFAEASVSVLLSDLIHREPSTNRQLHPDLLFRHAATSLYQDAHLQIERNPQLSLPGLHAASVQPDTLPRDVRFTPPNLARLLVQKALSSLGQRYLVRQEVIIFDPACGSGVFLVETLRELADRGFKGRLKLIGYDLSPVSTLIAKFCLLDYQFEAALDGIDLHVQIETHDSLEETWPNADVVIMNPPFIAIDNMTSLQRDASKRILGDLNKGRVDIAMSFVWKATIAVAPGGAVATIVPGSLLSTESGKAWREAIRGEGDLTFLGRFEGYRFFPFSLVETAFFCLRKTLVRSDEALSIPVLIAQEGREDIAIRAARVADEQRAAAPAWAEGVEAFILPAKAVASTDWKVRPKADYDLLQAARDRCSTTVEDIFNVHQGVLTGSNEAFILEIKEYERLPAGERSYFRPIAGQGSIVNGLLKPFGYVFYPYTMSGLQLKSERELSDAVPIYYRSHLAEYKPLLAKRRRKEKWWELSERRGWQSSREPRLYTTYFGRAGSFVYDGSGDYVVTQGYCWLWRASLLPGKVHSPQRAMHVTNIPMAYLSLLNSDPFQRLLGFFCPQVQGGQFNLSIRFVNRVPLPNLLDLATIDSEIATQLAFFGQQIGEGNIASIRPKLNFLAQRLLGGDS